ncbi:MAG: hypothetical protein ACREXV_14850 [Polaromonas sp.]
MKLLLGDAHGSPAAISAPKYSGSSAVSFLLWKTVHSDPDASIGAQMSELQCAKLEHFQMLKTEQRDTKNLYHQRFTPLHGPCVLFNNGSRSTPSHSPETAQLIRMENHRTDTSSGTPRVFYTRNSREAR